MSRIRRPIRVTVRRTVWERDQGRCWLCGKRVRKVDHNLDHLLPVWWLDRLPDLYPDLDPDHADNLAVSHPVCNRRRPASPADWLHRPEAFSATLCAGADLHDEHTEPRRMTA